MSGEQNSEFMADPYSAAAVNASAAGPRAPPPSLPSGWAATPDLGGSSDSTPDYLFETDFDESFRRSWGERLTFHTGGAYLVGLVVGGGQGLYHGLKDSAGERQRIRINTVLNSTAKRGPGLANGLGCVALMGSFFESLAYNIRGEDDLLNPAGAAALTGMLYKSAAGPRMAAMAAVGLGTFTAAATLLTKQLSSRGMLKNFL